MMHFTSIPFLPCIFEMLYSLPPQELMGRPLRLKFSERNVNEPETPKEDVSESQSEESQIHSDSKSVSSLGRKLRTKILFEIPTILMRFTGWCDLYILHLFLQSTLQYHNIICHLKFLDQVLMDSFVLSQKNSSLGVA